MGLPAMQAQRPEPTGETIGRAIEPWIKVGLKYLILWDVFLKIKLGYLMIFGCFFQ